MEKQIIIIRKKAGRKRLLAAVLVAALAFTTVFASVGTASATDATAKSKETKALTAPPYDYTPSTTTDYIAAKFDGITAGQHVFDVVTVERFTKSVLGQDGNSVIVLGSPKNESTKKTLRYINDTAKAWGIDKIYFFDPNLAGEAGADITDASSGAPYAARTDDQNKRIWTALKTAVTSGSTDNLKGARLKHIPAGYTSDKTLLFVYNRKPSGTIIDSADTILSSLLLDASVDVSTGDAQNLLKTNIANAFGAVSGWTAGNTDETFYDQYWWFKNVWSYTSGNIDGIASSKFTVKQVTQPELVNVLNTPGTHNVFISGSWCGDSRALTAYLAENASKANEPVYVFDFRVSGGIGDTSAYSVLRSEASTTDGGYGYTGLGFIGARLVDLLAPFESGTVNTTSKYYPDGNSNAALTTSPNRNFRSPFLAKYTKGNNSQKGQVVKEWVHQTQDWEAPWKNAGGYEPGQVQGAYLDYEVSTGGTNQLQNARARYALAEFFGQPSLHTTSGYLPSSSVSTNVSKSDSGCGDDNDPLDDLGEATLIPNQGTSDYDVQNYNITIDATGLTSSSANRDFIKGTTIISAIAKKNLTHIELDFKPLAVDWPLLSVNKGIFTPGEGGADSTFTPGETLTVKSHSQVSDDNQDLQKLSVDVNQTIPAGTGFQVEISYTTGILDTFVGNGESPQGFFSRVDGAGIAAIGEPLGSVYWFPNNNKPADGAKYKITLKYPSGYEGVGPGTRESRSGTQSVWKVNREIAPYQAFASIGKYTIVGGTGTNYLSVSAPTSFTKTVQSGTKTPPDFNTAIPYYNYVNTGIYTANASRNRDKADAFTHELPLYIRALENIAGPYHGESAGFVFDNLGDGHGSAATWGAVETADRPFFTGTNVTSERTFVHEYAHQWYGDSVRIAGWEDLWLNEGFATYVTDLYYEQKDGSTFSAQDKWKSVYNNTAANKPWWTYAPANIETEGDLFGGASAAYNRGALALASLREKIGDTKFFELLKGWATDKKGKAASTADFVSYASGVAGTDLTGWAKVWLYGAVKPTSFTDSESADPKKFTVNFNSNGGTSTAAKILTEGTAIGKLPSPSRTGYTFLGWYTANTGGTKITDTTKVSANITYYAQWKVNTFTVTFNANGGKAAAAKKLSYNSAVGQLPQPTRTGYKLLGWYTAKTGGKKVGTDAKVTASVTYYAHWVRHGWVKSGKYRYYYSDGKKATYWQKIRQSNGKAYLYYFGSNGKLRTGWQKIKNGKKTSRYYFGSDGKLRTGWQTIKGKRYYFGGANDGRLRTGKVKIGGKYYTFTSNGALKK